MATRTCPTCGSQYVASVRRCISCDVLLVDETPDRDESPEIDAGTSTPIGEGDHIAYELEGWGNQLKVTLEGMLDIAGVPRAWEGGALVVPASQEDVVDGLIASVEGTDRASLDPDAEQVAFEIEGLDVEGHDELTARLIAEGIDHGWSDEGDLLVLLEDDERVSAIIDEVIEGEVVDGGEASMEALSDLYVAVDRLMKDPLDVKLGERTSAAVARLQTAGVPYGFSAEDWEDLQGEAGVLVALLAGEALDAAEAGGADDLDEEDEDDEDDEDDALDLVGGDDEDEDDEDLVGGHDEDDDDEDLNDELEDEDGTTTRRERIAAAARDLRTHLLEYV